MQANHEQQMSIHTARHIPPSGVDRKLKDKITESGHFLVAEMYKVNMHIQCSVCF